MDYPLSERETIQQKFPTFSGGERCESDRRRNDTMVIPKKWSNKRSMPQFCQQGAVMGLVVGTAQGAMGLLLMWWWCFNLVRQRGRNIAANLDG
jgi:hypothetical protein